MGKLKMNKLVTMPHKVPNLDVIGEAENEESMAFNQSRNKAFT